MTKSKTEIFIEKAKAKHGDIFDYSKCEYTFSNKKVKIICKEHGEFSQEANSHLQGSGCSSCAYRPKVFTKEEYKERVAEHHGDKYDYSLVGDRITLSDMLKIICPDHGEFEMKALTHSTGGMCASCSKTARLTQQQFEKKANELHNNKYDYSKSVYKTYREKITIICPDHGEFTQFVNSHLRGCGCPKCSIDERGFTSVNLTQAEFEEKVKAIHGTRYDYSETVYVNRKKKISIRCKEHGVFKQIANNHLRGANCPSCKKTAKLTKDQFVEKVKLIHGDKYDYSESIYTSMMKTITIACKDHGNFSLIASSHFKGSGCPKCRKGLAPTEVGQSQ